MFYDGSIRIDSKIDEKGFNSSISSMTGRIKTLGAAIGVAFGLTALVNFGKTAVNVASELSSAMIGLQSVVEGTGNSFTQAKGFINNYIKDGLVPITNATTAYKNLLMRGYDTSQIETVLTALKDSASFGRQASLTLGNAVQSATEGLKNENSILVDNAGVTKNVSMMWKDYAATIGTTVGALTKQQKIQAEVNGILEESRFQTGDAAKLAGTYAGQVSALGVSFYNLKVGIGNSIIPIISRIMPYIKVAVDGLVVFFNKVAQIMSILFGVQISGTTEAIEGLADSTNSAADAQQNLADATTAAGKAAKGALASFDELNVLQMETGDSSGSGGTSTTPGGMAIPSIPSVIDTGLDELKSKVEAFKTAMITFLTPVIEAFDRLKQALIPLDKTIWEGLKWAWDNVLVPLGTWVITNLLPTFLDLVGAAAKVLNSALIALKPLGIWFWEDFLQPIAQWTGGVIINTLNWLVQALEDFSDWINNNQQAFRDIVVIIASFFVAWKIRPFIALLSTMIPILWKSIPALVGMASAALAAAAPYVILASAIASVTLALMELDKFNETAEPAIDAYKRLNRQFAEGASSYTQYKQSFDAFWDSLTAGEVLAFSTALATAGYSTKALTEDQYEAVKAGEVLTESNEKLEESVDEVTTAVKDMGATYAAVSGLAQTFTQDEKDMQEAVDNLTAAQAEYNTALVTGDGLDVAKNKLEDAQSAVEQLQIAQDLQTKQWVLNIITQQLSIDGLTSDEMAYLLQFQKDSGLISESAAVRAQAVYDGALKMADGFIIATDKANGITSALNNIPRDIKSTVTTYYVENSMGTAINRHANGGFTSSGGWALVGDSASGRRTGFEELVHALPGGGFQVFPNSSLAGFGIPKMATGGIMPVGARTVMPSRQSEGLSADAVRSIIRDEMGGQNVKVNVDFGNSTLGALVRTLNPVIKQENERMGPSLLNGATS